MPSDRTYSYTRVINGKKFDFHRMKWRDGINATVFVTPHNSTTRLHEFNYRYGKLVAKEN
jgi:environmental stress-induced protein Ves